MDVCEFVYVFIIIYRYKKCGFEKIHKVIGHDMYIIDIMVCGSYENFEDKICLDMGVFFCEGVRVNVFFLFM